MGGKNHYFTILFSYWFWITTVKDAIVSNQKHLKVPIQPDFSLMGEF
jgi:hypothetical protein